MKYCSDIAQGFIYYVDTIIRMHMLDEFESHSYYLWPQAKFGRGALGRA